MEKKINRKALKKSMLSSVGRLISIMLGTASGAMLKDLIGQKLEQVELCVLLFFTSLILLIFFEYGRELE